MQSVQKLVMLEFAPKEEEELVEWEGWKGPPDPWEKRGYPRGGKSGQEARGRLKKLQGSLSVW